MTTNAEALAQAVQYHQAGNLAQAERIYRQILQNNSADANALHLLGMLAYQVGQHQTALDLIRQAVAVIPQAAEFHSNLAGVYLALGRAEEAIGCYEEAVRLRPDLPELHRNLGLALAEQGRVEEALASLREALRLRPDLLDAHNDLGNVFRQVRRFAEAEDSYRQALRLWPDNADVLSNLGAALAEQGRFAEAEVSYHEALRLRPDLHEARYNLGLAQASQGKLIEALASYEHALRIKPDYVEALTNQGNVLKQMGRLAPAEASYREALRLLCSPLPCTQGRGVGGEGDSERQRPQPLTPNPSPRVKGEGRPDHAEVVNNLAAVLLQQGRVNDAMASFREALRLRPNLAQTHATLAELLLQEGQREEAVGHFREALRHDPNCVTALAPVVFHDLYRLSDAELRGIRALAADSGLPPADVSRLHFALGSLSDRAGAHDDAFAHYRQAHALRRRILQEAGAAFDALSYRAWIDQIIATFEAAYFRRNQELGRDTERPVFIVGMPRSGTSLVEHILASHPEVLGAGELKDFGRLITELMPGLTPGEDYPNLGRLDGATAGILADRYLQRIEQLGPTAARVTDKTPSNFQLLGLIAALFPRARVIHCLRDPVDVCFSCYTQDFTEWTLDLDELAQYYREYERLMAHWRSVLPLRLLEVRYEELVEDPEAISRRLVSFCGLDWDDRCLAAHQTRRPVRTSSLLQVRQPVYKSSVGRWRRYAAHLRPLLEALGRPLDDVATSNTCAGAP